MNKSHLTNPNESLANKSVKKSQIVGLNESGKSSKL